MNIKYKSNCKFQGRRTGLGLDTKHDLKQATSPTGALYTTRISTLVRDIWRWYGEEAALFPHPPPLSFSSYIIYTHSLMCVLKYEFL